MITDKDRGLISNNGSHASYSFISSWSNNYLSWLRNKQFRRLFVKYEDLLTNKYETFRDIIVFSNTLMNRTENVDKSKLQKAIETTNFDILKNKEVMKVLMGQIIVLKIGEIFTKKIKIYFLTLVQKINGKKF
jgi:uncharacterized protein (DUF488 family)